MGNGVARTLREVADGDTLLAPQPAMELLELIVRQLPKSQRVTTLNIDAAQLSDDGTLIHGTESTTPQPQEVRIGEFLVYLLLGRPALSADDAFEPAVQKLPNAIVALVSRDLGQADGQWVLHREWLDALQLQLNDDVMALTPQERAARRRQRLMSTSGAVAVALISTIVVVYAMTSWASS